MPLTIIHISDLHFHAMPSKWKELPSKRALGFANLYINRRRHYPMERASQLVLKLQEMEWDHLVISGDLTSLALEKEFQLAHEVLSPLLAEPEKVTVIPGNHDKYVSGACQPSLFHKYFGTYFTDTEIKTQHLFGKWHLIAWDSTHPNDWRTASGTVQRNTLLETENYIRQQAPSSRFIIANHYPLWFPSDYIVHPRHELHNLSYVRHWIQQQSQVLLYLHGHIHRNWHHVVHRKTEPLYLVNSASSTSLKSARQKSVFHRIQLSDQQVEIEPLTF